MLRQNGRHPGEWFFISHLSWRPGSGLRAPVPIA
jgi:hypothetical protein